jgi:hypothetical protein
VTDDRNDAVDGQPLDEVTGPNESDEPRDESPPEPPEPTPEELAERAARADKSISRALAGVLWLEAVCVLLVPRAIAQTSVGLTGVKTGLLIGFAIVLVAAGILVCRRVGLAAAHVRYSSVGIRIPDCGGDLSRGLALPAQSAPRARRVAGRCSDVDLLITAD